MTVFISIEPCMAQNDAALQAAGLTPGIETYIEVTQTAVRAILAQYPEIDGIEVFTWENQAGWPVPESADATWALLAERLRLPIESFTHVPEPARRHLSASCPTCISPSPCCRAWRTILRCRENGAWLASIYTDHNYGLPLHRSSRRCCRKRWNFPS